MPGKNSSKQSRGDSSGVPCWTCQSWYPKLLRLLVAPPLMITHRETLLTLPGCQKLHPLGKKLNLLVCHFMRRPYRNRGLSERATNIVLQSWRQSLQKQYDAHIRKWLHFCTNRQADPIHPIISMAVDFLTTLYDKGLSYSSINWAWCALSVILESPVSAYSTFGEHPDVKRFMKGIFQSRPPLPRYCKTWDVNLALQYIGMGNSQKLSPKPAQRGQSLHLLHTQNMVQEGTGLLTRSCLIVIWNKANLAGQLLN